MNEALASCAPSDWKSKASDQKAASGYRQGCTDIRASPALLDRRVTSRLELHEAKVSRAVPRGGTGGNARPLPGGQVPFGGRPQRRDVSGALLERHYGIREMPAKARSKTSPGNEVHTFKSVSRLCTRPFPEVQAVDRRSWRQAVWSLA